MKRPSILGPLALVTLLSSCTYINEQSFQIHYPDSASAESIMDEIVVYFQSLGFDLERRSHITYPTDEMFATFYLSTASLALVYTSYSHIDVRLVDGEHLYLKHIQVSDWKREPSPDYFDEFHRKVAREIEDRLGIQVTFTRAEEEERS